MKKNVTCLLALLVIFTGCGNTDTSDNTDTSSKEKNADEKTSSKEDSTTKNDSSDAKESISADTVADTSTTDTVNTDNSTADTSSTKNSTSDSSSTDTSSTLNNSNILNSYSVIDEDKEISDTCLELAQDFSKSHQEFKDKYFVLRYDYKFYQMVIYDAANPNTSKIDSVWEKYDEDDFIKEELPGNAYHEPCLKGQF